MRDSTKSAAWMWLNIGMIVFAAAIVLFAPFRRPPVIAVFGLALVPAYFVCFLWRQRLGNVPLGQVYAQARAGKRLPWSTPLEVATAAVVILADIVVHSSS